MEDEKEIIHDSFIEHILATALEAGSYDPTEVINLSLILIHFREHELNELDEFFGFDEKSELIEFIDLSLVQIRNGKFNIKFENIEDGKHKAVFKLKRLKSGDKFVTTYTDKFGAKVKSEAKAHLN